MHPSPDHPLCRSRTRVTGIGPAKVHGCAYPAGHLRPHRSAEGLEWGPDLRPHMLDRLTPAEVMGLAHSLARTLARPGGLSREQRAAGLDRLDEALAQLGALAVARAPARGARPVALTSVPAPAPDHRQTKGAARGCTK